MSLYALKKMLNHAGDVTSGHYVKKSDVQLRAGRQAVADFIEQLAAGPCGCTERRLTARPIAPLVPIDNTTISRRY